ncbi:hypothetical protein SEVIR_4G111133v4 [Setaria viridis]
MHCDGVMDSDREKRASVSAGGGGSGGGDYFGSLPDDVLLLILLRLPAAAAARTTALSRRWRKLFTGIQGVFLALPGARARVRFWGRPRRRGHRRPRVLHCPPPPRCTWLRGRLVLRR